jgi:hypothetical protein
MTQALRWQVINALDIATEIAIIGLVVYLVFALQTPYSSKLMVVFIFSYRLLLLIFIGFRMYTFDSSAYTRDPFLANASFISWSQAEISASLITATIPTFRNFLKSLSTGFGGIGVSSTDGYIYGYGSQGRTRMKAPANGAGSGYQLSKLQSTSQSHNRSMHAAEPEEANDLSFRPQTSHVQLDPLTGRSGGSAATAHWSEGTTGSDTGPNADAASIGSDESRRMIIRKEMNYTVRTEPRERYGA